MAGKRMIVGVVLALGAVGGCATHESASDGDKPPAATGTPVTTNLRFSGDLKGSAQGAVKVRAAKTGAHYDYTVDDGVTQCVMPADDAAWEAQINMRVNGVGWQINIDNGQSFGYPKSGKHVARYYTEVDPDKGELSFYIASDKPVSSNVVGNASGPFEYTYYIPYHPTQGRATVTIDPSSTSGTLDAWLVPWGQELHLEKPLFHLTGRWSCNG
ncbi:hypothetical protein [Streptomyces sp. NPDC047024]|uniref:hypothetical protein n=1 Tax=Streptomyces sp. NPDC047024 TaxID=3155476 RepID=UPI0033D35616